MFFFRVIWRYLTNTVTPHLLTASYSSLFSLGRERIDARHSERKIVRYCVRKYGLKIILRGRIVRVISEPEHLVLWLYSGHNNSDDLLQTPIQ